MSQMNEELREKETILRRAEKLSGLPSFCADVLLHFQNRDLGELLTAERVFYYLNILYGMMIFRRGHELEPLHDDVFQFVAEAQQSAGEYDGSAFAQDMRQLEQWGLVTKRIERERLRGYRDTRRKKFRYRLTEETLAFLYWLEEQLRSGLEPRAPDTRDLLEEVTGGLRELRRILNKIYRENTDPEQARSAIYRLERLGSLTLEINQSLADFNSNLIAFTLDSYEIQQARAVLEELEFFLEKYLKRILSLRRTILPELEKLLAPRMAMRWTLCRTAVEEEQKRSSMLMRSRTLPDAALELARLQSFYASRGQLDQLCARVRSSAREVWRKLYTHLRELERKSHRMEDLKDRIAEMAAMEDEGAASRFIHEMLAPSRMIADMNYWDEAEKADPPQPRLDQHRVKKAPVCYLKPKTKGDPSAVRSLNQQKMDELQHWIELTQRALPAKLSSGNYTEFNDFSRMIELVRTGLLSSGRDLSRIGLQLEPSEESENVSVCIEEQKLRFRELMIAKAKEPSRDR